MKEYIDRIVEEGDEKDMHRLSEMLEDLMCEVKKTDEESYKHYEIELYEMAYGKKLNKDMAEEIVNKMKPVGMKWAMEQTTEVKNKYGLADLDEVDFFVVMNSAYNDYHDLFQENLDMYVKYANDFIRDVDAVSDKVFVYFTTIV